MKRLLSHRPTAAMLVACLALFVALGGVGYAAATIGSAQIANNAIKSVDVKNGTLRGKDVGKNTLGGSQVKESRLGKVPSAASADSATSAQSAASAQNAANAGALGGAPASDYVKGDGRGLAVAGAVIDDDGSVESWFNRAGGAPTVNHGGTGDYTISFPGVDASMSTHVATGTVIGVFGLATVDYTGGKLHLRTYDGNLATDTFDSDDRAFSVLVQPAGAAG